MRYRVFGWFCSESPSLLLRCYDLASKEDMAAKLQVFGEEINWLKWTVLRTELVNVF